MSRSHFVAYAHIVHPPAIAHFMLTNIPPERAVDRVGTNNAGGIMMRSNMRRRFDKDASSRKQLRIGIGVLLVVVEVAAGASLVENADYMSCLAAPSTCTSLYVVARGRAS